MPDDDALAERLRAVERALTDGDADLTDVRTAAARDRRLDELAARLDEAEARLDDIDAATQALRGYVGAVRSVNDDVERRADAALAKAERLEADAARRAPAPDGPTTASDVLDPHAAPDDRAQTADESRAAGTRTADGAQVAARGADSDEPDAETRPLTRLLPWK